MAELTLQWKSIILAFFLIDNCVRDTSKALRTALLIDRGDRDTFDNPTCNDHQLQCENCTVMNAYCSINAETAGCYKCTCFDQYKTYLENWRKCVRDEILLFFPVGNNSFMMETKDGLCLTINRTGRLTAGVTKCNSTDPFQRWIRSPYDQLVHVNTATCIQQGPNYPNRNYTWYLDLKECNMTEKKQKWYRVGNYLRNLVFFERVQNNLYINLQNQLVVATLERLGNLHQWKWRKKLKNEFVPDEAFSCNGFAEPLSPLLVLDPNCQRQGERQIANLPLRQKYPVTWNELEYLDNKSWKKLVVNNCFMSICHVESRTYLKWNFTGTASKWKNMIIKWKFAFGHKGNSSGCVVMKIGNKSDACKTTPSTVLNLKSSKSYEITIPPASTTPSTKERIGTTTKVSQPKIKSTSSTNSKGSFSTSRSQTTSKPPATQPSTSSQNKQEGESSSVVGITVGVLVPVLVLCGVILACYCYKKRTSRLDKFSSNVGINCKAIPAGDTMNPVYSSENKISASYLNDGGIYQEPDENKDSASQECQLYEPGGDNEYDYASVDENDKLKPPSDELEYDYAKNDDVKSAVQRNPVKDNDYQDHNTTNKNISMNTKEDKETANENDAGPVYQTIEDGAGPVYQTLEDE